MESSAPPAATPKFRYSCGITEDGEETYKDFTSYEDVWAAAEKSGTPVDYCDTTQLYSTVSDAEAEALRTAYGDDAQASSLGTLYGICAQTGGIPIDETLNGSQASEARGALMLCPNHPKAKTIQASIAMGDAADAQAAEDEQAKKDGRLITGDGAFLVGSEIQPGTWVTTGDKLIDCYWELSDAQGNIIDNNFVSVSPQLTVTINEGVSGFTTQGCGSWRMQ